MKHIAFFKQAIRIFIEKCKRAAPVIVGLFILLSPSLACSGVGNVINVNDVINVDDIINEIDDTRRAIEAESGAWRNELSQLQNTLKDMESRVSADAKALVADTANQVQDLSTNAINLTNAKAEDLVAQAGVEFRCNADFVKRGVLEQLQFIIDDLKFWQDNGSHLAQKPNHAVCWINPSAVSLYPSGNNWLVDSGNMSEKGIVYVYGYNFRADALPTLELQNAEGQALRKINVTPAYVTHYQINLDFANETFPDVTAGGRVVFRWPDVPDDPNTINLTLRPAGKLQLSNPVFSPPSPVAQKDAVTLKVTVTNTGGLPVQAFTIKWQPDPADERYLSVNSPHALQPGQSQIFQLDGSYVYQRDGDIEGTISLSTGDELLRHSITVLPAPPSRFDYRIRLRTWDVPAGHAAADGEVRVTLVGTQRSTGEIKVAGNFRRGEWESVIISNVEDIGDFRYVKINYDDGDEDNGWALDRIEVTNLTTKTLLADQVCHQWYGNDAPLQNKCP